MALSTCKNHYTRIGSLTYVSVYFRYITKLLSDLIYFVCSQESFDTGGDPLDVEMVDPNDCRERQKLLREQNIVKQVKFECSSGG